MRSTSEAWDATPDEFLTDFAIYLPGIIFATRLYGFAADSG